MQFYLCSCLQLAEVDSVEAFSFCSCSPVTKMATSRSVYALFKLPQANNRSFTVDLSDQKFFEASGLSFGQRCALKRGAQVSVLVSNKGKPIPVKLNAVLLYKSKYLFVT